MNAFSFKTPKNGFCLLVPVLCKCSADGTGGGGWRSKGIVGGCQAADCIAAIAAVPEKKT